MTQLDITTLDIESREDGRTKVKVWAACWSSADIDDLIAWLKLAKTVVEQWQQIRKTESLDEQAQVRQRAPQAPPAGGAPEVPRTKEGAK